jgi:uncharacterized protein (DUF427 family)
MPLMASNFPPESIRREHLLDSDTHTSCGWKGPASYITVEAGGEVNGDAAWYYPDPKPADYAGRTADELAGRFAFWKGVKVEP